MERRDPSQPDQRGLDSALYSVCAVQDEEVIGCGRVVGDGGMYFYLQDVIVLPAHQGEGIGRAITARLMAFVESRATPGSFVGLMAAKGVSGFYERFGFAARATDAPGMFRVMR